MHTRKWFAYNCSSWRSGRRCSTDPRCGSNTEPCYSQHAHTPSRFVLYMPVRSWLLSFTRSNMSLRRPRNLGCTIRYWHTSLYFLWSQRANTADSLDAEIERENIDEQTGGVRYPTAAPHCCDASNMAQFLSHTYTKTQVQQQQRRMDELRKEEGEMGKGRGQITGEKRKDKLSEVEPRGRKRQLKKTASAEEKCGRAKRSRKGVTLLVGAHFPNKPCGGWKDARVNLCAAASPNQQTSISQTCKIDTQKESVLGWYLVIEEFWWWHCWIIRPLKCSNLSWIYFREVHHLSNPMKPITLEPEPFL